MDTRSPSVTPIATPMLQPDSDSTVNSALLYYENPNGAVSGLLRRTVYLFDQYSGSEDTQWVDITSQESKSLPNGFRNVPHSHYNHTLYESYPNATFSAPFTSAANSSGSVIGALFSQPNFNLQLENSGSPPFSKCFVCWLQHRSQQLRGFQWYALGILVSRSHCG